MAPAQLSRCAQNLDGQSIRCLDFEQRSHTGPGPFLTQLSHRLNGGDAFLQARCFRKRLGHQGGNGIGITPECRQLLRKIAHILALVRRPPGKIRLGRHRRLDGCRLLTFDQSVQRRRHQVAVTRHRIQKLQRQINRLWLPRVTKPTHHLVRQPHRKRLGLRRQCRQPGYITLRRQRQLRLNALPNKKTKRAVGPRARLDQTLLPQREIMGLFIMIHRQILRPRLPNPSGHRRPDARSPIVRQPPERPVRHQPSQKRPGTASRSVSRSVSRRHRRQRPQTLHLKHPVPTRSHQPLLQYFPEKPTRRHQPATTKLRRSQYPHRFQRR